MMKSRRITTPAKTDLRSDPAKLSDTPKIRIPFFSM
jgi:hypothetical protein